MVIALEYPESTQENITRDDSDKFKYSWYNIPQYSYTGDRDLNYFSFSRRAMNQVKNTALRTVTREAKNKTRVFFFATDRRLGLEKENLCLGL